MIKQKVIILVILMMALLLSACGAPKIRTLTLEELKNPSSKRIFVYGMYGYRKITLDYFKNVPVQHRPTPLEIAAINANAEITARVQDFLKKKGWQVIDYHKVLTDPTPSIRIAKEMGYDYDELLKRALKYKDKEAEKILQKIYNHPSNWLRKRSKKIDFILDYFISHDLRNKNEYYINIYIRKITNSKTEGIYKIKKRILFTKDKAADYISTAIIMAIKDIL